jgi:hypothetical protein
LLALGSSTVAATELLVIFGEMSARHVFVAVADDGREKPGQDVEVDLLCTDVDVWVCEIWGVCLKACISSS